VLLGGVAAAQEPPRGPVEIPTNVSGALREHNEPYHLLHALNRGFEHDTGPNLQTPQATVEFFSGAGDAGHFRDAAQALNMNLVVREQRAELAPKIAERLHYVMDRRLGFDWEALPDRPDGIREQPSRENDPLAGRPRRSLKIGSLPVQGRDISIRLQRVKVGDDAPRWVFSPQTVANVGELFDAYGPGPIEAVMPPWARVQFLGLASLWAWLGLLLLMAVAGLIAWGVRTLSKRWLIGANRPLLHGTGKVLASPIAFVAWILLVYVPTKVVLPLPRGVSTAMVILLICAFTWLAMRFVRLATDHLFESRIDDISQLVEDDSNQQQLLTYLSVGRRVLFFILFLIGLGVVVAQFEGLRSAGFSMMASAGVAAVLLGIAAQPVLGNIVAGLQVALSKPVRIGDSVLYEGNWGYVEDITYTYVLILTWDQRRLVVPLTYFVTKPFENWTMRQKRMIKPIIVYADYAIDVDRVRAHFAELLADDEDWDEEEEPRVEVVEVDDETIAIRALCSAADPSTAWRLHCRMREALVAFVRDLEGGRYLPRRRHLVEPLSSEGARASSGRELGRLVG